jgi:hypothetical protein
MMAMTAAGAGRGGPQDSPGLWPGQILLLEEVAAVMGVWLTRIRAVAAAVAMVV